MAVTEAIPEIEMLHKHRCINQTELKAEIRSNHFFKRPGYKAHTGTIR